MAFQFLFSKALKCVARISWQPAIPSGLPTPSPSRFKGDPDHDNTRSSAPVKREGSLIRNLFSNWSLPNSR